jgi:hypothetical protein
MQVDVHERRHVMCWLYPDVGFTLISSFHCDLLDKCLGMCGMSFPAEYATYCSFAKCYTRLLTMAGIQQAGLKPRFTSSRATALLAYSDFFTCCRFYELEKFLPFIASRDVHRCLGCVSV